MLQSILLLSSVFDLTQHGGSFDLTSRTSLGEVIIDPWSPEMCLGVLGLETYLILTVWHIKPLISESEITMATSEHHHKLRVPREL